MGMSLYVDTQIMLKEITRVYWQELHMHLIF
jgi:hypothetical protein